MRKAIAVSLVLLAFLVCGLHDGGIERVSQVSSDIGHTGEQVASLPAVHLVAAVSSNAVKRTSERSILRVLWAVVVVLFASAAIAARPREREARPWSPARWRSSPRRGPPALA